MGFFETLIHNFLYVFKRRVERMVILTKVLAIAIALTAIGLGIYLAIGSLQYAASSHKIGEVLHQAFLDKYGVEVKYKKELSYTDVMNKYAMQGVYLLEISQNSTADDWYLVCQKGTSPETEILCVQNKDGKVMDSYPYDKMVELADTCGLAAYLKPNAIAGAKIAYSPQELQECFSPIFVTYLVKSQSEDFFLKWDAYVQKLREEETIWGGKECVYALFEDGVAKNHPFKIFREEDKKSESKRINKLKKWISKQ